MRPRRKLSSILSRPKSSHRIVPAPSVEGLEARRMFAVLTANGTAGNDVIGVSVTNGTVRVVVNGVAHTMADSSCTGIAINAVGGNDQIFVLNNTNNPVDINAGTGNDIISIADGDFATITADVGIDGGTNTSAQGDIVIIDDSDSTGTFPYTISAAGFGDPRLPAVVAFSGIESFTLNANDIGTTINVLSTSTGTSTINANGGDDSIVLGSSANRYSTTVTNLAVHGGAGTDSIRVDDQGTTFASSFTLTPGSIVSTTGGPTTYDGVESVTVNGGSGDNAHVIETVSATTALTLNCGAGDDSVQVNQASQLLSDVAASLTVNGQGGVDSLTYFDGANFSALNYIIGADTLTSTMMPATTTYLGCETVTLNGTTGPASWDVRGSSQGTTLVLNANDDSDGFNLNWPNTSGMNLFGDVTCNGGGGENFVNLFDQFHTEPTRYDVTDVFLRVGYGTELDAKLNYTSVESLSIFTGGDVDDSFNVHSLAADIPLLINAAGGDFDTLALSPQAHNMDAIHGPIVFNHSGDGAFTTFFDYENTTPVTYSYSPGQPATRTGFAGLTGFGTDLNIYAGTSGDTFLVSGTNAGEYIYCNGGDGNDSAMFGNGMLSTTFAGDAVFDGDVGTDSLVIDGSAETTGYGYSYSNGLIHPSFRPNFGDGFNSIDNESFVLKTGSGADGISVSTGIDETVAIELYAGAGQDNINVLRSGPIPVVVDAGSGLNQLYVDTDGGAAGQALLRSSQLLEFFGVANSGIVTVEPGSNSVLTARNFSVAATATLDLNDNDLIVDYTGPSQRAAVQALINSGRANGAWTGFGITSTTAKSANPKNTALGVMEATEFDSIYGPAESFSGQPIDTTAVLVKYTYYGDVDFNGVVDFDDYSRVDAGFNNNRTGWLNGDVDGNGIVDFDDYSLIDQAFNTQSGTLRGGAAELPGTKLRGQATLFA